MTLPDGERGDGLVHRRRPDRRRLPGDQRRHRRRARSCSEFTIGAVTEGQDALGEVSVVLEVDGVTGAGQGVSTDIIDAAARAYVRALSVAVRALARRRRDRAARGRRSPERAQAGGRRGTSAR